ncbi:hypothetical protein OA86_08920 [Kaistella jeonii]|uniref:Uncharacterized protein n=1 Tax=Kaistella jeonii TaxID=266749 RepID=A0A0C1FLG3_9FLAO|nr:hypothetical protein OA86_08920 [Kaistella jeonii]
MTYRFPYIEKASLKINRINIEFYFIKIINRIILIIHFILKKENYQLRCGVKNTPHSKTVFFIRWPRKDNSLIPIF